MALTDVGSKKRKPPTFQHLPIDRAKKLKRDWVEKQKIKSKWKVEKRKAGIVSQRDVASLTRSDTKRGQEVDAAEEQSESSDEEAEKNEREDGADGSEDSGPEELDEPPPSNRRKASTAEDGRDAENTKSSLRELQKQAYSKASLHTFKSDPLHRSRGRGGQPERGTRGRGRGAGIRGCVSRGGERGGRGRGGGRGDFHGSGRGRGQPDMRLRMSAMLEKIKRDFA